MNPEAVEWLEGLTLEERGNHFHAPVGVMGELFSIKPDHEPCVRWFCGAAEVLVID